MAVSLTCDSCGASISPDALRRGLALEHQGSHYCERCKGPIVAFIKNTTPAPSAPVRQPPVVPPDLEGEDLDDELDKLAAKRQPPAPAPRPVLSPAAPRAVAPPRPTSKPPIPRKPAVPPRPAPVTRPGTAPRAVEKPAVRPGPAPAPKRPGAAFPGMRVVKPAPPPGPGEEEQAPPRRRSKKLLLGMGGGTAALVLLTGIVWINSGPGEPPPTPGPAPGPDPSVEVAKAAEAKQKAFLEAETRRLAKFRESIPAEGAPNVVDKLFALRSEMEQYVPPTSLEPEFRKLAEEVGRRITASADQTFQEVLKRSNNYQKEEKFTAAGELWKSMPEVVRQSELRSKWKEEEDKAGRYAQAWAQWTKIDAKADKYLGQDDVEISVAILSAKENYPSGCERLYPLIWKKREERIRKIQENAESERQARRDREYEREIEQEEKERIRLETERRQRWTVLIKEVPWLPLISRDGSDLENWTHRSWIGTSLEDIKIPWSIQLVGGQPAIVGNNPSDHQRDIEIGMNGNRWLDWVLEFEVQVESGTMLLKNRTLLRGEGTYNTGVLQDGEGPKDFEFPSSAYGAWKKVRVEVQGRTVTWIEDGAKKLEVESGDRQKGGFVFALKPGSTGRIRDVRMKLIFDEKREKEEDEE